MSQPQNKIDYDFLPGHPLGVAAPLGFRAGTTYCGLKTPGPGKLDLGILVSDTLCSVAGVFTTNVVRAASVLVNEEIVQQSGKAQAIIFNAGNANACTGEQGLTDAYEMARLTATKFDLDPAAVLVTSTGVIGHLLPMDKIRQGVAQIELHEGEIAGTSASFAIMTTDTRPKRCVVRLMLGGRQVIIGGMCKGAGMIHPNLATMLCYITTDVAATPLFLQALLSEVVQDTFNMITVDGDSSTNDSVLVMANGKAHNPTLGQGATTEDEHKFKLAFGAIMTYLAKEIARDGEGATKLLEIIVRGAVDKTQARLAARTAVGSNLTKAAMYGNDPNWGRIIAAIGRSGAQFDINKVDISIAGINMMQNGVPQLFDKPTVQTALKAPEVLVLVDLHTKGEDEATAWGCDLTQEYVVINSEYET